MSPSIEQVSEAWLRAWGGRDLAAIASLLHPDIHFRSPNGETRGSQAYLAAAARMLPLLTGIEVQARLHGPDSAMLLYDFVCREPVGAVRTAERVCVVDGRVHESEVLFDPRPLDALAQAARARPPS